MNNKNMHRALKMMLDLAQLADEKRETPFDSEMGLGYRCFAPYIREGVKEVIQLQNEYYSVVSSLEYNKNCVKEYEEFLTMIFGSLDVTEFNDDEIAKIKVVVDEIMAAWEVDE